MNQGEGNSPLVAPADANAMVIAAEAAALRLEHARLLAENQRLARSRRFFWRLLAFVGTAVPVAFVCWQTLLIKDQLALQADESAQVRRQVEESARQTELVRKQFTLAETQDYRARRTELIATIYAERTECADVERVCPENISKCDRPSCPVAASRREREDAVREFLAIERAHGVRPDLERARFDDLSLYGVDFTGTALNEASFARAQLMSAKFDGQLIGVSFRDARLCGEEGTNGASFEGAQIILSSFKGASLCERTLARAMLKAVRCGDGKMSNTPCPAYSDERVVLRLKTTPASIDVLPPPPRR